MNLHAEILGMGPKGPKVTSHMVEGVYGGCRHEKLATAGVGCVRGLLQHNAPMDTAQ